MRIWFLIATLLYMLLGVLGAGFAMMSPMMFDAPGSTENQLLWTLFWTVISFPVSCLIAIIGMWVLHLISWPRAALVASVLPLLHGVVFAIVLSLLD